MAIHYRTSGFILKKVDRGEADRIFTIYTKDFGKLEILARALRKIKSKLRGGIELFYLSEIEFIQGKTYKTLTDVILIENFPDLRKDLKKLNIANKISETLDNLVKGEEKDEKIWDLLNGTFQKLNNQKLEIRSLKLEIIYYYFFWNLLSVSGYQPELYNCALCQKKLVPENIYFSSKEGGAICSQCGKSMESAKKITPETIKILRIFLKKNWDTLKKLKIEPLYLKTLKSISADYLTYIFGEQK